MCTQVDFETPATASAFAVAVQPSPQQAPPEGCASQQVQGSGAGKQVAEQLCMQNNALGPWEQVQQTLQYSRPCNKGRSERTVFMRWLATL